MTRGAISYAELVEAQTGGSLLGTVFHESKLFFLIQRAFVNNTFLAAHIYQARKGHRSQNTS